MKKNYLQFLSVLGTWNVERFKGVKIFFLVFLLSSISYSGYSQVIVTPANNTTICAQTAVGGGAPACTTLGVIAITETNTFDLSISPSDQLVLTPPAGWVFCTSTPPVVSWNLLGDIVTITTIPPITSTSLTLNINVNAQSTLDQIKITGLMVQPSSTSAPAGSITASTSTGMSTGITVGVTDFGDLAIIPAPITGIVLLHSLCVGDTMVLSDATPGGVWTSSSSAIVVTPGGDVAAVHPGGSATVTYTVGGCYQTFGAIATLRSPGPILGLHDVCAWFPRFYIHDADSPGVWSTGAFGANVLAVPSIYPLAFETGTGYVEINAPGIDTIKFTDFVTGCTVTDTFTVWPLPTPIVGNDTVCQGSTILLSDAFAGGVWSSLNTLIATVGSGSGFVTGVNPGTATISYTLPTGCGLDTTVYVNPIPKIITGSAFACLGATTILSDSTAGGTWSVSNTNVSIVPSGNTVAVTGLVPGGVSTITYTLSTGCYVTLDVTVNPVPSAIIPLGTLEECQGDSTIALTDPSGGGDWSSANTSIATVDDFTGFVYGVSGGTDVISYAFPTGCYATITVTIDPSPAPITGPDSLCVGKIIVLSDATPSGLVPTAWTSSTTTVATIDPAGFVFGVGPGTSTITYTLPTGCFVTFVVTVNPLPAPITGPSVLCVGSSITLSDASAPGGYFTSSNTAVATIDSFTGVVNGLTIGSTTITYTLFAGGCSGSSGFTVTVTPDPTPISGPDSVCIGQTITLSDGISGGAWISGTTMVATIGSSSGVVTGMSVGTSIITYFLGTCPAYDTVTVLDLAPITGPDSVCQGSTITLNDATLTPGTWSSSNTSVATIDPVTGVVTGVLGLGVTTISYTLVNGCVATYSVTVDPFANISYTADTMCLNQSLVFCDAVPGGVWSSTNTSIAIVGSAFGGSCDTIYGVGSGTVIISYTLAAGGCVAIHPVQVDSLPRPLFIPPLCEGSSEVISDPFTSGTFTHSFPSIDTIAPFGGSGFDLTITGLAGGLDTLTFTIPAGGCSVKDTFRVYPIDPISGNMVVCVGNTTTLTDTTTGGTWVSLNPGVGTIDPASGLFIGISAGTATVSYTMGSGCTVTAVVTVNPLPGPIYGPDSVCVGATVTLNDTLPRGGFWLSGSPGIGNIDIITGIVTGVTAGTTTITYTITGTGCKITTVVTVNATPLPITADPLGVCLNFTTLMTDPSPGGVWSNADTFISRIGLTGIDSGIAPGIDTIFYTYPITGCFVYEQIVVHAPPVVTVTAAPPGTICIGQSTILTATGATDGGIPGSYEWLPPAYALSSTTTPVTVASPTVTTTYTVVGTTTYGCRDTASVIVLVDTFLIHLKITGRPAICIGDTDMLTATGNPNALFAWNPITNLSCTICDTTIAAPVTTTTYEATAIDALGCKDSAAFTVIVMPLPTLSVIAEPNTFPITLCRGTPLQLVAKGAWSYVWTPNLFLSCDSCANPVATDTFNMVYELTGYTEFGCVDSMPVRVSVLDTNYNIVGHDTDICFGTTAQLFSFSHSVNGNLDEPTYLWSPPDGLSDPFISNPTASPAATTVYTLVITENACFRDTAYVRVGVQPYPIINLSPPSETVNAGTPVQLVAEVLNTPVQSYAWSPADGLSCDTCFNPRATPLQNTKYTVIVTSIYHCASQDTVSLFVSCNSAGQVFIPNTFTPNGDGVNDRFFISAIGLQKIVYMRVYNRWGQLIFEADNIAPNNPAAGWDGTFKGQVLEPDVFMYEVSAICELGAPFKYKGDVSIVR
jgi:gliding motility-associated-like protein